MRSDFRRAPARHAILVASFVLAVLGAQGCSGFDPNALGQILDTRSNGELDNGTVVAGLKEALQIGTERTVQVTSRPGGFFDNPRIRIPLPESLESVASKMRTFGLGSTVDEFELAMNRGAERAAGEATDVFWNAIRTMTFQDAMGILRGSNTAATDYFRGRTTEDLRGRFRPIVREKLGEVGLYRTWDRLVQAYTALPATQAPTLDLEGYVTERALGGLFETLATEETRIREDPAARTTKLLRDVFGAATGR
jgi:hypothetical protein